jgi:hypothetical protein
MKFKALLASFRCMFNRHDPLRRAVKKIRTPTGKRFIGICRHCGAPIRRRAHKDWVRDTSTRADD